MEITKLPNKILAKKMEKATVDDIKKGLYKDLVFDMRKAMVENSGVGLAANQVGKDLSIFVIDKKLVEENNVPDVFINPEITKYSKDNDETEEGCLSIPDYWVPIKRSKKIKIKFIHHKKKKKDNIKEITIKNRNSENPKL